MKVLLINANQLKNMPVYPIGIDYLSSILIESGYQVEVLDLQLISKKENNTKLISDIINKRYDLIGISIRNIMDDVYGGDWYIPSIKQLVRKIRRKLPHRSKTVIALGGAGLSISPKEVLNVCGGDVAIQGEGEIAILKLLQDIKNNNIENGRIYNERVPAQTYQEMRYYRGHGLDLQRYRLYGAIANVQTKRGCSNHCLYCNYPLIEGRRVRLRNPSYVVEEVEYLLEQGFKEIFFVDSVFNMPFEYSLDICKEIKRRQLELIWHGFHTPRYISEKYLDLVIATNGHKPIQLCIESGSDKILRNLQKSYNIDDIYNAIDLCHHKKVEYAFSLLLGGPGETEKTVSETFEMLRYAKPKAVSVLTGICIHPGTPIAQRTKNILWQREEELIKPKFYPFKEGIFDKIIERLKEMKVSVNSYYNQTYYNYNDYYNSYQCSYEGI